MFSVAGSGGVTGLTSHPFKMIEKNCLFSGEEKFSYKAFSNLIKFDKNLIKYIMSLFKCLVLCEGHFRL